MLARVRGRVRLHQSNQGKGRTVLRGRGVTCGVWGSKEVHHAIRVSVHSALREGDGFRPENKRTPGSDVISDSAVSGGTGGQGPKWQVHLEGTEAITSHEGYNNPKTWSTGHPAVSVEKDEPSQRWQEMVTGLLVELVWEGTVSSGKALNRTVDFQSLSLQIQQCI